MNGPRIGSLFSGYGGLDQGVQAVLGGTTAWVSDIDPGACRILAHRYPDVPNLSDITAVNWANVEPVDVLTGGFPCQDVSHAGSRKGLGPGTRSGLWSRMADAIDHLRPSLVIAENVRGLLSAEAASDVEPCPWCLGDGAGEPPLRALGAVLADLAELGYDASWYGLRAADVGAPHGRFRVFVLARPADADISGLEGAEPARRHLMPTRSRRVIGGRGLPTVPDADGTASGQWGVAAPGQAEGGGARPDTGGRGGASASANAAGDGRDQGGTEPAGLVGGSDAAICGHAAADADGASSEACVGRPGTRHLGRLQPVVGGVSAWEGADGGTTLRPGVLVAAPERVMGYSGHVDAPERGSREDLPGVRGAVHSTSLREATGGPECLPAPEVLRPVLREHQDRGDEGRPALAGSQTSGGSLHGVRGDDGSACSSQGQEPGEQRPVEPADALLELSPQAALAGGQGEADGISSIAWGPYEPAIRRWERVLGRLAPAPTEPGSKGQPRLSPRFVEFLMGLPAGWVTDVPGLSRNDQLKALGNGVVPQQAAAAVRFMLARLAEERRWAA